MAKSMYTTLREMLETAPAVRVVAKDSADGRRVRAVLVNEYYRRRYHVALRNGGKELLVWKREADLPVLEVGS